MNRLHINKPKRFPDISPDENNRHLQQISEHTLKNIFLLCNLILMNGPIISKVHCTYILSLIEQFRSVLNNFMCEIPFVKFRFKIWYNFSILSSGPLIWEISDMIIIIVFLSLI